MKRRCFRILRFLGAIPVLCGSAFLAFALNREAFTFTNYDLNVQIEPQQHRLGVRGKVTLRNDTSEAQKNAVLQISSSLDWRSIKVVDSGETKPVQFVTQPYASDIDHTGALSEAIVSLPQPVAPKGTVNLEIAYEGVVLLDATRWTRIGTPAETAENTDWDRIVRDFVAVRGIGNVSWYPIATEAANLSDDDSIFEVIGRWKSREAGAEIQLHLTALPLSVEGPQKILINRQACPDLRTEAARDQGAPLECSYRAPGLTPLSFVIKDYSVVERPAIEVHALPSSSTRGVVFADAGEKLAPWIREWFGAPREKVKVVDLPVSRAVPSEDGSLLFIPVGSYDASLAGLVLTHQLTHASFFSFRPWIEEGLAHFAQALYLERERNRRAALDYVGLHRSAFLEAERPTGLLRFEERTELALVNTGSEELYRSKAMCVWWMLRDMIGDSALKKALASYHSEQDNDPSYMPRLIAAQTQRNLDWFFDDWVYHDRGLPDFKVESVFPLKMANDSYLVTVTVDNLGTAGAEVPVIVKFAGGEVSKRLEVRAKSKGVIRVELPTPPLEVVVNDGSVPEGDATNNTFKIEAATSAK